MKKESLKYFYKKNGTLKIINNSLIKDGECFSTDLDNWLVQDVDTNYQGLIDNLKYSKTGDLEHSENTLNSLEFPDLPKIKKYTKIPIEFINIILKNEVDQYTAKKDIRIELQYIAIEEDKISASNGHILFTEKINWDAQIYLHRDFINLLKKIKKTPLKAGFNEEYIFISGEGWRIIRKNPKVNKYSNIDAIIPSSGSTKYKTTIKNINPILKTLKPYVSDTRVICFYDKAYIKDYFVKIENTFSLIIGLNIDYLNLICKKRKDVTFEYSTSLAPVLIKEDKKRWLIMPMYLYDNLEDSTAKRKKLKI